MRSSTVRFRGRSLSVMSRACGFAIACGALVAAVGCGKSDDRVAVYPVSGKVVVKGQPAAGATVLLTPSKPIPNVPPPRASVGKDGTFKVDTYDAGDGAPEGEYKVTVIWYKTEVQNGEVVMGSKNVVPKEYSSPETTPAIARVQPGAQNAIPDIVIK